MSLTGNADLSFISDDAGQRLATTLNAIGNEPADA